ncbi:DUF4435 domain-containing protein [Vibrio sp. YT-18]|uniref:DUF4435 domain-containing protein n=1 Tax=Vibrio sp. YT-18 TaxID=3074709 RepID=UPI0029654917|nr:DUF4435 domain-containing protein [Vibrio sp. YT-18]MDW1550207.1 DUF4435 domain-containing protein [Vibrio sp. YT-18]
MSEYRINEIFLNAEQLGEKVLIVEGEDDVNLYDGMFHSNGYFIYAVENIEKVDSENGERYQPGCGGVKTAITDLLRVEDGNTGLLKNHILGIVDKDVSDFRDEVFNSEIVFNLESYAIENHFVSKEVIKNLLVDYTKATKTLITEDITDDLYNEILNRLEILYLISLDSLRGAIDSNYSAIYGYDSSDQCFRNEQKLQLVLRKQEELLDFAEQHQLQFDENFIQKVVKGKWALSAFLHFFSEEVKVLVQKCNTSHIEQCQFCNSGKYAKCLYGIKEGLNSKSLKSLVFNYCDLDSLSYIKDGVVEKLG